MMLVIEYIQTSLRARTRGTCIIMRQTEFFSIYILLYMAAEEKHANAKKCAKKRLLALTKRLMFIIFLLKHTLCNHKNDR